MWFNRKADTLTNPIELLQYTSATQQKLNSSNTAWFIILLSFIGKLGLENLFINDSIYQLNLLIPASLIFEQIITLLDTVTICCHRYFKLEWPVLPGKISSIGFVVGV
jgi:hypothetical protein